MVALKIRKVGNSLGLVLPKEVISRLRTGEGEDVFLIEGPNNTYRITPFDPAFEKKMEKAEEIMARYRNTLHVLAKGVSLSGLRMIWYWQSTIGCSSSTVVVKVCATNRF